MIWLVDFNGSERAIDDQITVSVSQPSSPRIYTFTHTLNLYWGGTQGHKFESLYCMSLHSYSISIRGGTQGHRDTTQITYTVCLSFHTPSLFKEGHRNTGTQLESLILYVSLFLLHLYLRWDLGTQGHNSNPLFCLALYSYSISIPGGTQGLRDTTQISIHTQSLLRWDTGTQVHNSNPLFCMSLPPCSISIPGGTQGLRDTTQICCSVFLSNHTQSLFEVGQRDTNRITYTVCLSIHTQSLFEVGHTDPGTQLKSAVLSVSTFILNLYSRWDTGTQGHNSNHFYCMSLRSYSIAIWGGTQGETYSKVIWFVYLCPTSIVFEYEWRDSQII
jgi:hypothetical protein